MQKIHLSRRQIKNSMEPLACELDVTAKSGTGLGSAFAPSWDLVTAKKAGKIDEEEYRSRYIAHLRKLSEVPYMDLIAFGAHNGHRICFLCYCKDGSFCHTYILISYLISSLPDYFSIL